MNIKEALKLFRKNIDGSTIPTEYCIVEQGIVINTMSLVPVSKTQPAQYLVTSEGEVYPTNPMRVKYTKFIKLTLEDLT